MKRMLAGLGSLVAIAGATAFAEETGGAIKVTPSEARPSVKAPESNFTGNVRLDRLVSPEGASRLSVSLVTFEPGARTDWHTHPAGQTLIVTSGVGHVQNWGGEVQALTPGDVVQIPAGVKHWHGASANIAMSHYALVEVVDGISAEWLEAVSDDQYPG